MNRLTGFLFENQVAHGAVVELSAGVAEMLDRRAYAPALRGLLVEAMAAMPLLATHLRFEGRINLQFQSEGALKLLVAQVDHHLEVRAMAKAPAGLAGSFSELLDGGVLALMLEPTGSGPASQAQVPIAGGSLAQALEGYFAQSEQLPTLIRIAAEGDRACGFLLQRLPLEDSQGGEADWEELAALANTLGSGELLGTEAAILLPRLFGGHELRLFEPRPVKVACRCSRAGISRLLLSLGREEVDAIVAEQGRVGVTCEFCGREYLYNKSEAAELFVAAGSQPSATKH
jgi:molecular chaperone Hsp33